MNGVAMRLALTIGAVLGLASCQYSGKVETAFDPKAAEFIAKPGLARIEGHAFLTRFDNKVMNASGQYVYLVPATPYARERFAKLYGNGKFLAATSGQSADTDPLYSQYTRKTKAESTGRFVFDKVPKGDYFVATNVQWTQNEEAFAPKKGGAIYETVSVQGKEDEVVKVVVNGI